MHELALSDRIVRTVLSSDAAAGRRLTAIAVRVGALSAVNVSSLEFCMRLVLNERGMGGTQVRIAPEPAVVQCECGLRYEADDMFSPCPRCGGFNREVVSGTDVTIEYVEVDDGKD